MNSLSKAQVKFLRKESHQIKPIFQMGKQGLTEAFVTQVDQALTKRELIKFNLLQNTSEELTEVAEQIAEQTQATIVQLIGQTAILYRPSSKQKNRDLSRQVEAID